MATELDDIFTDDLELDSPVNPEENIQNNIQPDTQEIDNDDFFGLGSEPAAEESLLDTYLKSKGITNGKITIVDENDTPQEINFYDLSRDEQLEILNSYDEPAESSIDYDASEQELINHLRSNNLTVEDFLNQYRDAIISELGQGSEPSYDIDAYDDQELFLLDLKNKYDLTDEELKAELEKELQNEDIFNKKVSKLRAEYKELEDQYKASQQAEFEAKNQEQYNQFVSAMEGIATNTSEFHGIWLEDGEKEETLSYLLDLDESGTSQFSKDLNTPAKLYEAAWYLRYGKEAFQALESAYEAEIAKLKKQIDKPRVVVQNSKRTEPKNINDLF